MSGPSHRGSASILPTFKSRLLRNSFFNSFGWGATLIINLAAIPIIIRHLGVDGYGVYALLTGIFGYFGLLDFGLSDGVVKYVSHYTQIHDSASLVQSINAALVVQLTAGGVGVVLLCAFNSLIIRFLRVPGPLIHAASMSLYVVAAGFLLKMLLNTYNATLRGLQRFDVLANLTVSFSTLVTVTVVSVLLIGGGLFAVIVSITVITTANFVVALGLTRHFVPTYVLSLSVKWSHVRRLFSFGAYVFISRVGSTLNAYFLQVIVAVIAGPASVTYFAVPLRLTQAMDGSFVSIIGVIFPHMSALTAEGRTGAMQKLYAKASKYIVALSTPVFLFVIVFSRQILSVWLGDAFAERSWIALTLLGCATLVAVWTMVPVNTIYGTGDAKIAATFGSVVVALNLAFSILLTQQYGIIGTAAAVLITATQGPIFIWYVTKQVVKVSAKEYFEGVFAFHVIPAILFCSASLPFLWLVHSIGSAKSLLALGAGACFCMLYYFVLLKWKVVSLSEIW
jgi:O-antigen/teichoic acid export membrane protein